MFEDGVERDHRANRAIDEEAELQRRATAKAADPETRRWAVDIHAMLLAATADGSIMELLAQLEP